MAPAVLNEAELVMADKFPPDPASPKMKGIRKTGALNAETKRTPPALAIIKTVTSYLHRSSKSPWLTTFQPEPWGLNLMARFRIKVVLRVSGRPASRTLDAILITH